MCWIINYRNRHTGFIKHLRDSGIKPLPCSLLEVIRAVIRLTYWTLFYLSMSLVIPFFALLGHYCQKPRVVGSLQENVTSSCAGKEGHGIPSGLSEAPWKIRVNLLSCAMKCCVQLIMMYTSTSDNVRFVAIQTLKACLPLKANKTLFFILGSSFSAFVSQQLFVECLVAEMCRAVAVDI